MPLILFRDSDFRRKSMSSDTDAKSSPVPTVVVAGDVCIDWLSIPIDSLVPGVAGMDRDPLNWQLRGGRHMYARRGGAWLTADFLEQAAGASAKVLKPVKEVLALENVPPSKIIHSMIMLRPSKRKRKHEEVDHWAAASFEGYAGPPYPEPPEVKGVETDDRNAALVLLDDAGNGFRDYEYVWPLALHDKPMVLYKVRRPLCKGALWKRLKSHLPRTIALVGADELRGEGASINRELSWERSATDLLLTLARQSDYAGLRGCPFIVISFGIEAAALVRCVDDRISSAHLCYLPNLTEGGLLCTDRGKMSGFGSAFAATLAATLINSGAYRIEATVDEIGAALLKGVHEGLLVSDRLLEHLFGPCKVDNQTMPRPPEYPLKEIFEAADGRRSTVFDVEVPNLKAKRTSKELAAFRSWRILDSKRDGPFAELAGEVVRHGVEKVFHDVPIGQFGKLNTLDRSEIESYRSVRNLISEFLRIPRPERPLCLAVFGAPGGGKSFGVTQVARSLEKGGEIEPVSFNVSQWNGPEYLVNALHRVRDFAIGGKVPLVFFDEFDSEFRGQRLGWLKYFLAPMQDGVFADGLYTHKIGKAIFVFAGGTAATYAEFRAAAKSADAQTRSLTGEARLPRKMTAYFESTGGGGGNLDSPDANDHAGQSASGPHDEMAKECVVELFRVGGSAEKDDLRSAKLPDFDSRLRGHVDVFGLDPPTDTNLLRRALVLRSNIEKSHKTLIDAEKKVRIDSGVLHAFLQAPSYYHGARSIEAILEMSHLGERTHFDPSLLPPQHQLNLHVDGNAFMALVQHRSALAPEIPRLAKRIHELYIESELAKNDNEGNPIEIGAWASLYHWEDPMLNEVYKRSSREQAAYYPTLLAAAGCSFEYGDPDPEFEFSEKEILRLAQMEHERWVEERRIKQPDHPDLVTWADLPADEREKDIRTIKAIPEFLKAVGLKVVRLS
jgi:hypothetical protein